MVRPSRRGNCRAIPSLRDFSRETAIESGVPAEFRGGRVIDTPRTVPDVGGAPTGVGVEDGDGPLLGRLFRLSAAVTRCFSGATQAVDAIRTYRSL